MEKLGFFGLALALLVVAYFGIQRLTEVRPLQPDARIPTFQRVDPFDPRQQREATFESDDNAARDKLRRAVLEAANSLRVLPCDKATKARYIDAATNYARAWLSIAPCVATRTCRQADEARLDRAQEAFRTPLDRRVWEAMAEAHRTGVIVGGDFPPETAELIANMARDPGINPRAAPAFMEMAAKWRETSVCRPISSQR